LRRRDGCRHGDPAERGSGGPSRLHVVTSRGDAISASRCKARRRWPPCGSRSSPCSCRCAVP
jgi:hypothetical protein